MPDDMGGANGRGRRVGDLRERGEPFEIHMNGTAVLAFPGETIGSALLANGLTTLRRTGKTGSARGLYCCMGVCYECLVRVDGERILRACMTKARPGMRISIGGPVRD